MPKNIAIAASLPARPERLFDMYLDSTEHGAFTGQPVTIEPRAGAVFSAFGGMIRGKILHIEPKRQIVQTWRSMHFPSGALDSILLLTFWPENDGGRIELNHINVADEDFAGVSQGWEKYYWTPWRAYLTKNS
jgi:activator of HSP90 ATPase